jgi:tRNA modification GTPase
LREQIAIDGMPLHIIDTAGLRESADLIEQEGMRRAWHEIEKADRIILLVDHRYGITPAEEDLQNKLSVGADLIVVFNKIDLTGTEPGLQRGEWGSEIRLSAKTGIGLEILREHLKACMGYRGQGEGHFMARRRHLDAIRRADEALQNAHQQLMATQAGELVAEELRAAQNALAEITGEFTSDDLLGRIFSSFCIGK